MNTTNMPQFVCSTRFEQDLIHKIADRAVRMARLEFGFRYEKIDAVMDLAGCHLNGTPLDLERLAAAKDHDFAHDVFGIRRYLDRSTAQLTDCFLPRYAKPSTGGES